MIQQVVAIILLLVWIGRLEVKVENRLLGLIS